MIIINAKLEGENTYDITVSENSTFRVHAFDLPRAIDLVANHIEQNNEKGLYIDAFELEVMASCSRWKDVDEYAKVHNLTRCGDKGIYIEITNVKGCPNG